MYRDAGNYKTFDSITFSNPCNLTLNEIETLIRSKLIFSEFFEPAKFNVTLLNVAIYDQELDHSWHEFESVETTNESCDDTRTIKNFIENLE